MRSWTGRKRQGVALVPVARGLCPLSARRREARARLIIEPSPRHDRAAPASTRLPRRWRAVALLVSSLTGPALASGAEPRAGAEPAARSAHLQWQRAVGAEGCISGEELAAALQRRLRRGTIGGPEADVTLEGTIAPAAAGAPGWKAWIVV